MILLLICTGFLLLYAALIFYYRKGWTSYLPPRTSAIAHDIFISVIIPARNEEKNLAALLYALEQQSLPHNLFEVIVVDDHSTDATSSIAKSFSGLPIQVLQPPLPAQNSSKKKAIETGVLAARGELIVTTDADCLPGPHWLRSIHELHSATNANFIAAPVKFLHNNSLLQSFQALDFMTLQGITAASVFLDFHTMCNGANLAYRKQAFLDVKGYEGIDRVATGDDMLLMHKIWKLDPAKVFYLKNEETIVSTAPAQSWKEFINQRKRWASKTFVYDDHRILAVLVFVYLVNLLFLIVVIASFVNPLYWWLAVGFIVVKTLVELPFVWLVAGFYGEKKLLRYFLLCQPLHIFYTVVVGLLSQAGSYEWKGRRTK